LPLFKNLADAPRPRRAVAFGVSFTAIPEATRACSHRSSGSVDPYRTPHTGKPHVVERWKIVDVGKMIEVTFTVEDPGAFDQPWSGMRRFRREDDCRSGWPTERR
jgi:hypothetical protein